MSMLDPRAQYRRAQDGLLPELMNPHQIILVTLKELRKSLAVLVASAGEGRKPPAAHQTKALTAIYILQSSLDFEAGGEIADNLFRVYEFVRLQVMMVFQRQEGAKLDAALSYIEDIVKAWEDMPV